MTAVGFAMIVAFVLLYAFCDGLPIGWRGYGADACAIGVLSGIVLAASGIAAWLWRVMP